MKSYQSANLRNVAVIGHGKTGKTSLLDACLFDAGGAKRLGSVEDGTSALDCEAEELRRGMTIGAKLVACEWQNYKINFLDTPGYPDFVGDARQRSAFASVGGEDALGGRQDALALRRRNGRFPRRRCRLLRCRHGALLSRPLAAAFHRAPFLVSRSALDAGLGLHPPDKVPPDHTPT